MESQWPPASLTSRTSVAAKAVAASWRYQVVGTIGYHHSFQKTAWDRAAAVVADNAGQNDIVLVLAGNTQLRSSTTSIGTSSKSRHLPSVGIPIGRTSGSVLTGADLETLLDLADDHATTWLVLNSVANIENSGLQTELRAVSKSTTPYPFPDVRVISFD